MAGPLEAAVAGARTADAQFADAVVVAAGKSVRMGGLDKRLMLLGGRPLLVRALEAVAASPAVGRIVLVMDPGPALDLLRPALPASVAAVVPGGDHRAASVEAGLAALAGLEGAAWDPDRIVLVHDGARPLVTTALVSAVAEAARIHGAAIPVIRVADTVRRVRDGVLGETIERADLVLAQTPQAARAGLLREAFQRFPPGGAERFTDEAALLMACTIRVHHIPGDPVNLKVTLPDDLARAEALFAAGRQQRTGRGTDAHPFGPGEPLHLGGLEIPGAPRLHGHSDGDVALHAIADALLGAAAMGDLGRLFPADHRTERGISSRELLADVVRRVASAGWETVALDLTIIGARPRLGPHLDAIRVEIAAQLGAPVEAISIKASTGNLNGAPGAGRVLAAEATITLDGSPAASREPEAPVRKARPS